MAKRLKRVLKLLGYATAALAAVLLLAFLIFNRAPKLYLVDVETQNVFEADGTPVKNKPAWFKNLDERELLIPNNGYSTLAVLDDRRIRLFDGEHYPDQVVELNGDRGYATWGDVQYFQNLMWQDVTVVALFGKLTDDWINISFSNRTVVADQTLGPKELADVKTLKTANQLVFQKLTRTETQIGTHCEIDGVSGKFIKASFRSTSGEVNKIEPLNSAFPNENSWELTVPISKNTTEVTELEMEFYDYRPYFTAKIKPTKHFPKADPLPHLTQVFRTQDHELIARVRCATATFGEVELELPNRKVVKGQNIYIPKLDPEPKPKWGRLHRFVIPSGVTSAILHVYTRPVLLTPQKARLFAIDKDTGPNGAFELTHDRERGTSQLTLKASSMPPKTHFNFEAEFDGRIVKQSHCYNNKYGTARLHLPTETLRHLRSVTIKSAPLNHKAIPVTGIQTAPMLRLKPEPPKQSATINP